MQPENKKKGGGTPRERETETGERTREIQRERRGGERGNPERKQVRPTGPSGALYVAAVAAAVHLPHNHATGSTTRCIHKIFKSCICSEQD